MQRRLRSHARPQRTRRAIHSFPLFLRQGEAHCRSLGYARDDKGKAFTLRKVSDLDGRIERLLRSNCRSLGYARDDKGKAVTLREVSDLDGRIGSGYSAATADPSATLGMTRVKHLLSGKLATWMDGLEAATPQSASRIGSSAVPSDSR